VKTCVGARASLNVNAADSQRSDEQELQSFDRLNLHNAHQIIANNILYILALTVTPHWRPRWLDGGTARARAAALWSMVVCPAVEERKASN
jgi:hypothetical protein